MAFLSGLEERFNKKMEELYSRQKFPMKESADLHPIIEYRPNDKDKPEGTGGSGRSAPVRRVLTDQKRMTKYLTSTQGIKFMLGQQVLQTGNIISETRIINPLFINLNLTPQSHTKRQLFDQTDVQVADPDRSPATTPNVGLAGRLQKQTGKDAISRIMGKSAGSSLLDVLSATQIGNTVTGLFQVTNGTYGVNKRPEFDVNGRLYSVILHTGRKSINNKYISLLGQIFSSVGIGISYVGIPNIIGDLSSPPGLNPTPNYSGAEGIQKYFITDADQGAIRYIKTGSGVRMSVARPNDLIPSVLKVGSIVGNLFGLKLGKRNYTINTDKIKTGPEIDTNVSVLEKPELAWENKYRDEKWVGSYDNTAKTERLKQLKADIKTQIDAIDNGQFVGESVKRGIVGGITISDLQTLKEVDGTDSNSQIGNILDKGEARPILPTADSPSRRGYYHDELNMISEIKGSPDQKFPIDSPLTYNERPIEDYIKVQFVDLVNNRLIPFRAMISGLQETVTAEYSSDKYVGRTERNIVYAGATRNVSFNIIVHAFSPIELEHVWKRVNTLTGLVFPAQYSVDGYMLPPLVELTIGNVYENQPGYITNITNTFDDEVSWEITDGYQVPMTVTIGVAFDIIEKTAMHSQKAFYGFGVPQSNLS